MAAVTDEQGFQRRMQQIEEIIGTIESSADPATRAWSEQLIALVLELHSVGLARVLELVSQSGDQCAALSDELANDELVGSLLLLHGLHPLGLETRVARALESVRPYLESHGGNVELMDISDGSVRLRLEGSCHGCPSSTLTLKSTIEEAVYAAAPDITGLEVEGLVEPPIRPGSSFVAMAQIR